MRPQGHQTAVVELKIERATWPAGFQDLLNRHARRRVDQGAATGAIADGLQFGAHPRHPRKARRQQYLWKVSNTLIVGVGILKARRLATGRERADNIQVRHRAAIGMDIWVKDVDHINLPNTLGFRLGKHIGKGGGDGEAFFMWAKGGGDIFWPRDGDRLVDILCPFLGRVMDLTYGGGTHQHGGCRLALGDNRAARASLNNLYAKVLCHFTYPPLMWVWVLWNHLRLQPPVGPHQSVRR